ncbi:type VI secretion system baseplate subunit TssE [Corallincola holothuriorum]|uniref:Type VI secretion system baseplate subunit TssE n=1 Tax=Corallincola holothuriorum TaxID=2282215 RepID=A0A368NRJ5_9GAMM|nr:type VI secretion system baseplate subunit TssE [Corallincola holothuriorum]RCU52730.1 type VI secretion system baseplate subunit TssE [Corallincola holothuriorum]
MPLHSKQPLQRSLLDRLIDDDPTGVRDSKAMTNFGLRELRDSVRRDLEALLNSRSSWLEIPDHYEELQASLVNYGLPDFSSMQTSNLEGRQRLCQIIEEAILRFEPRFVEVSVTALDEEMPLDRILKIRINAYLHADPLPEEVSFDSELEPVHLGMLVKEVHG